MRIPKRSTHAYVFVSNIKDPLAGIANPFPELMDSFLLSETYSTKQTLGLTADARKRGDLIISDNGNFSRMKAIAARFILKGQALLTLARNELLRKKELSKATLLKREKLMAEIVDHVKQEQQNIDVPDIVARQLACAPHYMIGMEDLTIPVLHTCNMLHPVFRPDPKVVKVFQKNTLKIYDEVKSGTHGFFKELKTILTFLVYHA